MDKNHKLLRYDRKNYSELVDFPVEIVGRDSIVRRYTFEDSIRLYQRRISCAPIRHRDPDLVLAEVHHCRARIEQLRRSYFHRYGWGTPQGAPGAEEWFGDLSGELAAFLCRVFAVDGRPDVRIEPVMPDTDGTSAWHVARPSAPGMLLYLHRFDGTAADAVRERFFGMLKELDRTGRTGGDAEKLLAFHHTVDCGFVLTGRGGDFASFVHPNDDATPPAEVAQTPWDDVIEIIRQGEHEAALKRCRELVREQPWHRNAYVAGAMLGCWLGDFLTADDLAYLGAKYFPKDGVLQYYLGVCRLRLGRKEAGEAALREALTVSPELVSARLLLVVGAFVEGRHRDASLLLREGRAVVPDDSHAAAELENLERWSLWRQALTLAGAALVLSGVAAGAFVSVLTGIALAALGGATIGLGRLAFRRHVTGLALRPRIEEIGQGLRRLHRRTTQAAIVS